MQKGMIYGIAAYSLWGLFPVYWKLLKHISAVELIGHRIVWSFLFLGIILLFSQRWKEFRKTLLSLRQMVVYALAGLLLSINWLTYVWGVNAGFIVETSLGYFINPLISVVLGVIFLREQLRSWQWVAVGLAAIGVIYLTISYGQLPWIALTLAFTFAIYGLVKKLAPLGSLYGLSLETGLLFLPALGYLILLEIGGTGAFGHTDVISHMLMIGAGLVTTVPLLLFASAARSIPLSVVGILQYIAPTLQFLIGIFIYKEPFTETRLLGFLVVWIALVIFWVEGNVFHRQYIRKKSHL